MNKLKNNLYNIIRNYVKNYLTNNLGKVVEDDEKITCYVKRNKIKKKNYSYTITCPGINDQKKKIADKYSLNKTICYVIDGLDFKKHRVQIFGYDNCEVIIKNCNFELNVSIHINGKCTLDNTNIDTFSYLSIGANELTIKNMSENQIKVIGEKSNIFFDSNDRINVINSSISNIKKVGIISFYAPNELNIVNSKIESKQIECQSNKIVIDENSSLIAKDKVSIKTDDFTPINIDAPTIVLNDEEITNQEKSVILKKITDSLTKERLELINLLKNIKVECENINSKKLVDYQKNLKEQPICKTLKK